MTTIERRRFLLFSGLSAAALSGCSKDNPLPSVATVDEAIANADTDELKHTKLALRGYELVSYTLGSRLLFLPYPGMRILSVVVIASGIVAKLAIEYIDDELIRRQVEEELTGEVRAQLEANGYVEFKTASGITEKVYLAPAEY